MTVQLINFFAIAVRFAEESIDEDSAEIDAIIVIGSKFM